MEQAGQAHAAALVDALDGRASHHRLPGAGAEIHWRQWGQGTPLVLLHGGHGSWLHWVRNIDALARHFRVLAPDLPGFGDSQDFALPAHDPARLDRLLRALQEGLQQLVAGEDFHLAGFSFGAAIAGLLAPQCPGLQRLALLGPAGHGGARRTHAPLLDWRVDDAQARQAAWHQNLGAFMLRSEQAIDPLAMLVHGRACLATRFRSKAISRGSQLVATLEHFERPMLMVWGEADVTAIPTEAATRLAQGREQREWTVLPGAGHWVQFERAHEVNTLLAGWLLRDAGS